MTLKTVFEALELSPSEFWRKRGYPENTQQRFSENCIVIFGQVSASRFHLFVYAEKDFLSFRKTFNRKKSDKIIDWYKKTKAD